MLEYPIFIHAGSDMGKPEQETERTLHAEIYPLADPGVDMRKPFVDLIPELRDGNAEEEIAASALQTKPVMEAPTLTLEQRVSRLENDNRILMQVLRILAVKNSAVANLLSSRLEEFAADQLLRDSVKVQAASKNKTTESGTAQDAAKTILDNIRRKFQKPVEVESALELCFDDDDEPNLDEVLREFEEGQKPT